MFSVFALSGASSGARWLVEQLHQAACDLPFAKVGDVLEFAGEEANAENRDPDDAHRWLLIQSKHLLLHDTTHS